MINAPRLWRGVTCVAVLALVQAVALADGPPSPVLSRRGPDAGLPWTASSDQPLLVQQVADFTGESYDARTEIDSLRSRLEQLERAGAEASGAECCQSCCECCCDPCCRSDGFYGGAEVAFLKVFKSTGTGFGSVDASIVTPLFGITVPVFDASLDPGFEPTPRAWVGYQASDGVGFRTRFWEFDHAFDGGISVLGHPVHGASQFQNFDVTEWDLEFTDSSRIGCNWDMTVSYGARYSEYRESRGLNLAPFSFTEQKHFTGWGCTTSVDFRRPFGSSYVAYATIRASVLFGDEDNSFSLSDGHASITLTAHESNNTKYDFESQAGIAYVVPMCGGGYYYARAGVETQFWGGFGAPVIVLADESTGFFGFDFAIGVQR